MQWKCFDWTAIISFRMILGWILGFLLLCIRVKLAKWVKGFLSSLQKSIKGFLSNGVFVPHSFNTVSGKNTQIFSFEQQSCIVSLDKTLGSFRQFPYIQWNSAVMLCVVTSHQNICRLKLKVDGSSEKTWKLP